MKTQKQLIKLGEKLANYPIHPSVIKTRNQTALNPLLKKGGIHDKDNPKTRHKKERAKTQLYLKSINHNKSF